LFSAEALIYAGRVPEALERCRHAIRLNPNCPDWYYWELGVAHFHLGEYDEALNALLD
jgi:tetratricopeptide (TPR) repeat protein